MERKLLDDLFFSRNQEQLKAAEAKLKKPRYVHLIFQYTCSSATLHRSVIIGLYPLLRTFQCEVSSRIAASARDNVLDPISNPLDSPTKAALSFVGIVSF